MKYQNNQSLYTQLNLCSFTISFISFMCSVGFFFWSKEKTDSLVQQTLWKKGVPYTVKVFLVTCWGIGSSHT